MNEKLNMNRFCSFFACAALLLISVNSAQAQEQWVEYRPANGGFRLEFPGTPKVTTEDMATIFGALPSTVAMYQPDDSHVYIAMHIDYPRDKVSSDPQKIIDGARDGAIDSVKGTLRSERRLTIGNLPARHIVVDIPGTQVGIELLVWSGNRLIQVICVAPKGQENSATIDHVYKSFALVAR